MKAGNMTHCLENSSSIEVNTSHSSEAISLTNLALGCFILVSFLVGMVVNGLTIWVLKVRMVRTINTFWFLHLNYSYLICCLTLPFYAIQHLLDNKWIFGELMCKLNTVLFTMGMFNTVFLLAIISVDRYLFTCHPTWSRHHRTLPWAQKLVIGTWLASLTLVAPFLDFLHITERNCKTECVNNYAISNGWQAMPASERRVTLAFFSLRFLLAFLLPFLIIMTCYCCMGQEMRRRLVRTGKPYKVLVAAVASFLICRFPYYIYILSFLFEEVSQETRLVLRVIYTTLICFNISFTPILYVFAGEKFQQVFKMSTVSLLRRGFMDFPTIHSESHDNSSCKQRMTQESDMSCQQERLTQDCDLQCPEELPLNHV